jgi:protein gp37
MVRWADAHGKGGGRIKNSAINWTDHTFNPWIGCSKVSPGCNNCYAEALDRRKLHDVVTHWGPGVPRKSDERYILEAAAEVERGGRRDR